MNLVPIQSTIGNDDSAQHTWSSDGGGAGKCRMGNSQSHMDLAWTNAGVGWGAGGGEWEHVPSGPWSMVDARLEPRSSLGTAYQPMLFFFFWFAPRGHHLQSLPSFFQMDGQRGCLLVPEEGSLFLLCAKVPSVLAAVLRIMTSDGLKARMSLWDE